MTLCPSCKLRPKGKHWNSKWCIKCALERRKRPKSTLTSKQQAYVHRMKGRISGREMASRLGTSWSNVMRYARDKRLTLATVSGSRKYRIQPDLVKKVCTHYERFGMASTVKAFPKVKVRSVVQRYRIFKPRQIRWTNDQIVEVARMGGIVSFSSQAKYFKRPHASIGSIKSVWIKRFGYSGGAIHGMSNFQARHLVKKSCPYVVTRFWHTRRERKEFARRLYLWVDMERHLKPGAPDFIREGVISMAAFQRWIFDSKNPKNKIKQMIREREGA